MKKTKSRSFTSGYDRRKMGKKKEYLVVIRGQVIGGNTEKTDERGPKKGKTAYRRGEKSCPAKAVLAVEKTPGRNRSRVKKQEEEG